MCRKAVWPKALSLFKGQRLSVDPQPQLVASAASRSMVLLSCQSGIFAWPVRLADAAALFLLQCLATLAFAAGEPERVTFRSVDGKTDLVGCLYKPGAAAASFRYQGRRRP